MNCLFGREFDSLRLHKLYSKSIKYKKCTTFRTLFLFLCALFFVSSWYNSDPYEKAILVITVYRVLVFTAVLY
ncbi:Hypothetical protein Ccan_23470 [Capnocytophaga canimorsus Cc5]|uniref:Uncharacterized protein n=1 Tax=Capnocytophaga canimorsus (strain 5) TaxID=860228 RepID=F9YVV8_CAPCC|nr:Hypothetical protein Ccan_23470 [Capnocytophaga canimorsus Cc5]